MIEVPAKSSTGRLADWVELYVCFNAVSTSKSEITNLLKAGRDTLRESTVDSILTELERRYLLYGGTAPFRVSKNLVEIDESFDWRTFPEYVMCLIYSIRGVITPDPGTKLFERLSDRALRKYLNGETVLLGFPEKKSLNDKINEATNLTGEFYASLPNPQDKDKRVDSIGWLPHGDKRSGQVVVLMQSGAGKLWRDKKPIQLKLWKRLVWWAAPPIPALAVPELIAHEQWRRITEEFDLVFDRARLIRHTAAITNHDAQFRQEIIDWCDIQLSI